MNNNNKKNNKFKQEKAGFYVALSVCLVAVGLAAWSTFDSVDKYTKTVIDSTYESTIAPVNKNKTGVTEKIVVQETDPSEEIVENITTEETVQKIEPTEQAETEDTLQTMLKVTKNLQYPTSSGKVLLGFSEEPIKNETMNDFRAHKATDFSGDKGDEVVSMCDGVVTNVLGDEMFGTVVTVENEEMTIRYCGLENVEVKKGDEIHTGNALGTIGNVPFEEESGPHIHIEVIVNNRAIDLLSLIDNNR